MYGRAIDIKTCSKCKIEKELSEFNNRNLSKDGKRSECRDCQSKAATVYYVENTETVLVNNKKWADNNIEKRQQQHKNLYLKNKDKINKKHRDHYINNKHIYRAKDAKRRASKAERTPKWLSKQHLDQIKIEYALAEWCSNVMGVKYHVDHIVPLQGKNVSGLHVPWNLQVIVSTDNFRKGNRHNG